MKSRDGKSQRREEKKKEDQRREIQKKEDPGARKGRKVAKRRVFSNDLWLRGRKVCSLKRRVRSHLARWEMKRCTPSWREARLEVKMYKTNVGPLLEAEMSKKVHAVVARSTFPCQNVQNTPGPDHFWKLRCRKKCTPLWREAHFEVKSVKKQTGLEHFWDV